MTRRSPTQTRTADRGGQLRQAQVDPATGALFTSARAAQEGIYVYVVDGAEVRELVTRPSLVDLARHLARAPLTLRHPPRPVTPETAGQLVVGDLDNAPSVEEEELTELGGFKRAYVRVDLAIRRADAISAALDGVDEVSPMFGPVRDNTPGTHPVFGRYDRRRTGVTWVNHLALEPAARGGPECALALDAADAELGAPAPLPTSLLQEGALSLEDFIKLLLQAIANPDVQKAIASCSTGMASTEDMATVKKAVDAVAAKCDATEGKIGDVVKAQDALDARVKPLEAAADSAGKAATEAANLSLKELAARFRVTGDSPTGLIAGLAEKLDIAVDGMDASVARKLVEGTARRRLARHPTHTGEHVDLKNVGDVPPAYQIS